MARGNAKSKPNPRKGKRKDVARPEVGPSSAQLVPWRDDPLTDRMVLPKAVGGVYRVRKSYESLSFLIQSPTVATFNSSAITLSTFCTDYSSLTSVFDQYKLVAAEFIMRPQAQASAPTAASKGQLYSVIDYDDSTNLGSIAAAQAYDNNISTPAYLPNRRCFKPRIAMAAYSSAFTSFANMNAEWIDAASTAVVHYGVKFALDVGNSGSLAVYDLIVNTVWDFRAAR
jgi:hypothetical protein